jgi:hypothetical protein
MEKEQKTGEEFDALNGADATGQAAVSFAEQEFINYCDANDIDHNETDMEEEDRKDFIKMKKRFIKLVDAKRLVVDDVKLIYTVSRFSASAGDKLTISRPKGRDFLAMDGFKETQSMNKFNAFLASIVGKDKSYVALLDAADRQFLQDIGTLFITA